MALGGGTFTSQNKVLPGSYINIKSAAQSVVTVGERGTVAMLISLDWAPAGVFTVTADEFLKDSMAIFGYPYTAPEMQSFREVFKHAQKVHVYNLNDNGDATAASNFWATAKNKGSRGNALKVVIQQNIDDEDLFDVSLYMENTLVFKQTAASGADLADNPYVTWQTGALSLEAGAAFTGGNNGSTGNNSVQNALNRFDAYQFNVLCAHHVGGSEIGPLCIEYTKRMREEHGKKFQLVVNYSSNLVDYEGVVCVDNVQIQSCDWVAGALAGCEINKSITNKKYDGEHTIICDKTQAELEQAIKDGVFCFHKVDDDVRVLMDINSLTTFTEEKSADFAHNQTVRVTDNIHNDIKRIFDTKYLGQIQNDSDGRASLYGDICALMEQYAQMRAILPFDSKSLTVELGNTPNSVVAKFNITVVGTMEQLYMTIICD